MIDRSTAYPLFGLRAGRLAWELVRDGKIDIVHGLGASVLGYARRRATSRAPLVLNPQGLEEFGATSPGRARLKRAGYLPLRRAVLICAKAADRIIATDRALEPIVPRRVDDPHATFTKLALDRIAADTRRAGLSGIIARHVRRQTGRHRTGQPFIEAPEAGFRRVVSLLVCHAKVDHTSGR